MTIGFGRNSKDLKEALLFFVSLPDYFKMSFRRNLQYLCDSLKYDSNWVAMSKEELILRRHYDYLGVVRGPRVCTVDVFQHENLFVQLGLASPHHGGAHHEVERVVKRMVEAGILVTGTSSDGQMDFRTTRLTNPSLSVDEAVHELRKKLNE